MKLKKSAACIFCAACLLAGCGSESELLSELRAEKAKEPESDTSLDAEAPAEDIVAGAAAGNSETETDEGGEKEQEGGNGSEEPAFIYVHVCGAVENPGVYELREGSRVFEAVREAGGFTAEADDSYVNQAQQLTDGVKLVIPTVEQVKETAEGGESGLAEMGIVEGDNAVQSGGYGVNAGNNSTDGTESGPDGRININTASEAQLCEIPGIGATRAAAIVAYRQQAGGFASTEDIMKVSGIKEGTYEKIKDRITVN